MSRSTGGSPRRDRGRCRSKRGRRSRSLESWKMRRRLGRRYKVMRAMVSHRGGRKVRIGVGGEVVSVRVRVSH